MRNRSSAVTTAVVAVAGLVVSLAAVLASPRVPSVEAAQSRTRVAQSAAVGPEATRPRGHIGDARGRVAARPAAPAAAQPRPVRVQVPAARLDFPLRPVGVDADGRMALPADPAVLGWYRFGPAPGEGVGSVVLAGHLDSRRYGLGPLVRLREVELGAAVRVVTAAGTLRYTVAGIRRHDRRALPDRLFARSGPERLQIITCGGEYLPDRGGYQQNLVVTAVPD